MAKTQESPPTAAQAAEKIALETITAVAIDQQLLETTARHLYIELLRGELRGRDGKVVAQAAYARARDFALVTQAIRGGAFIPEQQAETVPLFCKVRVWDGSQDVHGAPLCDEHGQPVYEIQPVDRDAFAPHLPPEHPVNQRYLGCAIRNTVPDKNGQPVTALCSASGEPLPAEQLSALRATLSGRPPAFKCN